MVTLKYGIDDPKDTLREDINNDGDHRQFIWTRSGEGKATIRWNRAKDRDARSCPYSSVEAFYSLRRVAQRRAPGSTTAVMSDK
ncbi:hypothetical protein J6590_017079 [Homalodisca vitripennis]|nr:hypothetical protein J6590_017079 [Homalodisca vitripennis]